MWNLGNFFFWLLRLEVWNIRRELLSLPHTGDSEIHTTEPGIVWVLSKKGNFIILKYSPLSQLMKGKVRLHIQMEKSL